MGNTHPILFNDEMIRAILAGTKTQSRRVILPQPPADSTWHKESGLFQIKGAAYGLMRHCRYGQAGDSLWVREAWGYGRTPYPLSTPRVYYRADMGAAFVANNFWRPSIHMPRQYSRITLDLISVRAERLQDISESDAIAEGTKFQRGKFTPIEYYTEKESGRLMARYSGPQRDLTIIDSFGGLWNSINGKRGFGWDSNPWVWRLEWTPYGNP